MSTLDAATDAERGRRSADDGPTAPVAAKSARNARGIPTSAEPPV
jgi:hypothetical protein